nr:xylulose kinase-1 [Tanacetum cinerariifolium]
MTLTFAETYNMIAYVTKSDANEGFNQILDFLNESSIKYALTVNPNIYVSNIKQFWTTVAVKMVNDVIRLQALVDKKNVVVTEDMIREALHLDNTEGVECLPNEEIFAELARMGYEKPSTKLMFYKAFFSNQWKRVGKGFSGVETQKVVEQQVDEEGDAEVHGEEVNAGDTAEEDVTAAHGEVSIADEEPSIPSPTPPTPPPQPSHTSLPLLKYNQHHHNHLRVEHLEFDKVAQALKITNLKRRVKKLERRNKVKVLKLRKLQKVRTSQRVETSDETMMDDVPNQGSMIAEVDADADVVLEDDKEIANEAKDVAEDAKTKEQIEEEESKALKRLNETPTKKASKRQKLDEEVEELKRHLQIVPNKDDDVYT